MSDFDTIYNKFHQEYKLYLDDFKHLKSVKLKQNPVLFNQTCRKFILQTNSRILLLKKLIHSIDNQCLIRSEYIYSTVHIGFSFTLALLYPCLIVYLLYYLYFKELSIFILFFSIGISFLFTLVSFEKIHDEIHRKFINKKTKCKNIILKKIKEMEYDIVFVNTYYVIRFQENTKSRRFTC